MDRLQALAQRFRAKNGGDEGGDSTSSDEKRKVALLPYAEVKHALTRHAIVTAWALDTKKVFNCMVEILAMIEGAQRPERDTSWLAPKDATGVSSKCCGESGGVLVKSADGSSYVCTACGACNGGQCIDMHNPYRYFCEDRYNGKADPSHWSGVHKDEWGNEYDDWSEAEQMMGVAFAQHASVGHLVDAVALLRAYRSAFKHIPSRAAAAAAAWILLENPALKDDHRIHECAPPIAPFACENCAERFFVRRDLRVHRCPAKKRVRIP